MNFDNDDLIDWGTAADIQGSSRAIPTAQTPSQLYLQPKYLSQIEHATNKPTGPEQSFGAIVRNVTMEGK